MRTRRLFLVLIGFFLLISLPVAAQHAVNTSGGYTLAGAPLALRGYDPVSYFNAGEPVLGNPANQAVHADATYQFADKANQKAFEAHPEKYAPQFGGFCAFGVALGKKFDGDPQAWKIVDGKLYLNLNADIQQKWQEDEAGNIKKAHQTWGGIETQSPAKING